MFFIAPERSSTGALYGLRQLAPEHSIFAQLMFLLDVARLVTQAEVKHNGDHGSSNIGEDQQTQRLTLEFLVHLVGTGDVPSPSHELRHRMHLHMAALAVRLRAAGRRYQTHGDLAYLREVWSLETLFDRSQGERELHPLFDTSRVAAAMAAAPSEQQQQQEQQQPLTLLNIANGMSIFHYIEGLQASSGESAAGQSWSPAFVRQLWTDIVTVYAPITESSSQDLLRDMPADMPDLLLRYFELAKRPGVVAALMRLLEGQAGQQ